MLNDAQTWANKTRQFLRYLLSEPEFKLPFFCYAEAEVYTQPQEWWPLFGMRYTNGHTRRTKLWFDILKHDSPPEWYGEWVKRTGQDGVLSLTNQLQEQFTRSTGAIEPILALFTTGEDFEAALTLSSVLSARVPFFHYVPEKGTDREPYLKYYREIIQPPFKGLGGSPYPPAPLLAAVPLFAMDSYRPLLLASVFLFFAPSSDRLRKSDAPRAVENDVRSIASRCAWLQHRASRELSHRFHRVIDGVYGDPDAVTLLGHPAWTRRDRSVVSMWTADHDFSDFKRDFPSLGTAEGGTLRSMFIQSTFAYRRLKDSGSLRLFSRWSAGSWNGWQAPVDDQFYRSAYRWIKALYSCTPHFEWTWDAPHNPSYELQKEELAGVAALVLYVDSESRSGRESRRVTVDVCGEYFRFPVKPGARFLIPWLDMLDMFLKKGYQCHVTIYAFPHEPDCLEPAELRKWVTDHNDATPGKRLVYGLVLRITPDELRTVFEPGQHVEEIKKRLNHSGEQPNRSGGQGNDSSRVQDVLHCNVSGAFRAHHLPIDRECGYFFDLVSLGKKEIEYALIGVDEGEMGVLGLFWHNVTRNDGE